MIRGLINYVMSINHVTRKEQIVKNTDIIFRVIAEDTIPTLDKLIDGDVDNIVNGNTLLSNSITMSNIKVKNNIEFFVKLRVFFKTVLSEEKKILKLIEDEINEFVTDKSGNSKEISIMKFVSDLGSASLYTIDLVYFVLVGDGDTDFSKMKMNNIRTNLPDLISVLDIYTGELENIIKTIPRVASITVVQKDVSDNMLDKLLGNSGKMLKLANTSGFINNPIYHIRMWFVDNEIEKYESLKDKKKMIELKLLDLKLTEQNESSSKIKDQIKYYEEKLSVIEYDIAQIEKD